MTANEPTLWASVEATATQALAYWRTKLNFQFKDGSGEKPISDSQAKKVLCLIRAVSWIESKHGSDPNNHGDTDAMQCGNPADAWWKTLTNQLGQGDRIIGGPGAANYWANAVMDSLESDSNLSSKAKKSSLSNPAKGHDDSKFSREMSYVWGTLYLVHRLNFKQGSPTYLFKDFSEAKLIAGAIEYNGGGDPKYGEKIKLALDAAQCL